MGGADDVCEGVGKTWCGDDKDDKVYACGEGVVFHVVWTAVLCCRLRSRTACQSKSVGTTQRELYPIWCPSF